TVKRLPSIEADLAEIFLQAGAPELAMKAVTEAFSQSQRASSRLYYLRGRALQDEGDLPNALKSLSEALRVDPKSFEILATMASVLASEHKHTESVALLKLAYALQPGSVEV